MTSRREVLRVAAAILAVTALVAGCGGGGEKSAAPAKAGGPSTTRTTTAPASTAPAPTGQGGGAGSGACGLISTEEAAQLAKTAVQPGVERSFPAAQGVSASRCAYSFQPGNSPAVFIVVFKGHTAFEQMRQNDASDASNAFKEVSGIGDAAYRCCGGNLVVRHGDTALILSIGQRNGVAGETPVEDVKRLAALVISRL